MFGGLVNIGGTTCALNTLMQLIAHSNKLFNSLGDSFEYDSTNQMNTLVWNITYVSEALRNANSVTPGGLVSLIYELFPDNFQSGEQMDIHELWMLLSSKIIDEVGVHKKQKLRKLSNRNIDIYTKVLHDINKINEGKVSPWLLNIQSIQLSILKCENDTCGATPWNVEVYNSFEVDIPNEMIDTLVKIDQLLLNNHTIENLPEWKCDTCKHVGGIKQSQIYTLPIILIIVIKRFKISERGVFSKINTQISISEQLSITLNDVTTKYNLIGLGNHYGVYGGGHYTAHVLENSEWICYDDINRSIIDTKKNNIFQANRDAYMVWYETV